MKNSMSRTLSITLLSLLLIVAAGPKVNAQDVSVSYQTFYDNLAPYGQWINDPEYGDVWVPNEEGDFRPYGSRGRWVMTEYGNTWVSEDPWGWAVYHYGRWTFNSYYGWVWVPGYEWAPAWVSWRYGGGYSGWAPLGPGMNVGVSYNYPDSWWIFVNPTYMYQPNCISYWRGPSYNTTYIRQTTIINNYYEDNRTHVRYNYGPRAEVIQQTTHQPVQVYRVSQLNRPGSASVGRNSVSLYRPSVNRATVNTARPSNVMQAPRPIGNTPQQANAPGSGRPAFRQDIQRQSPANNPGQRGNSGTIRANEPVRQQPNEPVNGNRMQPGQTRQPVNETRQQPAPQQPMHETRQQPQQPMRQQPAPQQPVRQQPAPQQPMRQQPQQPAPQQPMRQQPQQPAPQQPMRQQPQQLAPQQPMRQQPQQPARQQPQSAPQRQAPAPQPRQEQPRQEQPRQEQPRQEQQQGGRR
jgi:hypothetical protein